MGVALLGLSRVIDAVTAFLGRQVRWLILLAIVVSAANSVLRKAFDTSSNAWLELQWLLFGAAFMLAAAYTLQKNAHVRIDVLSSRFSKRKRDIIDLFGHLFILGPFAIILLWLSAPYFVDSFREGEASSNAGGLPVWPAKFLIFAGMLLLVLQMVSEVIKRALVLAGIIHEPTPEALHGHDPADTTPAGGHNE
ncbi:TRAP transporter small permease subunit [Aestuariivirga sp.]|uniref:TRAP transporter small permease subunit n=1 Tax=Aestuariivirga sp. TaxID=2650926 RepID=UPI003918828C